MSIYTDTWVDTLVRSLPVRARWPFSRLPAAVINMQCEQTAAGCTPNHHFLFLCNMFPVPALFTPTSNPLALP